MSFAKNKKPKLSLSDIRAFEAIKLELQELYKKQDQLTAKFIKKYGEGEVEFQRKSGGVYRLTIKDNLDAFKKGEPVFVATSAHRYNVTLKEVLNPRKKK